MPEEELEREESEEREAVEQHEEGGRVGIDVSSEGDGEDVAGVDGQGGRFSFLDAVKNERARVNTQSCENTECATYTSACHPTAHSSS